MFVKKIDRVYVRSISAMSDRVKSVNNDSEKLVSLINLNYIFVNNSSLCTKLLTKTKTVKADIGKILNKITNK